MIENKSISVAPSEEQGQIDLMACFGWELKSSQELNVKESHQERRGDDIYSVTTQENYVKLVFSRDTKMENYTKITAYEKKYFGIMAQRPAPANVKLAMLGLLFFLVPGILYLVFNSKKNKAWRELYNKEAAQLPNQARALLQ